MPEHHQVAHLYRATRATAWYAGRSYAGCGEPLRGAPGGGGSAAACYSRTYDQPNVKMAELNTSSNSLQVGLRHRVLLDLRDSLCEHVFDCRPNICPDP